MLEPSMGLGRNVSGFLGGSWVTRSDFNDGVVIQRLVGAATQIVLVLQSG